MTTETDTKWEVVETIKILALIPGRFVNKRNGVLHESNEPVFAHVDDEGLPRDGQTIGPLTSKCGRLRADKLQFQHILVRRRCAACYR